MSAVPKPTLEDVLNSDKFKEVVAGVAARYSENGKIDEMGLAVSLSNEAKAGLLKAKNDPQFMDTNKTPAERMIYAFQKGYLKLEPDGTGSFSAKRLEAQLDNLNTALVTFGKDPALTKGDIKKIVDGAVEHYNQRESAETLEREKAAQAARDEQSKKDAEALKALEDQAAKAKNAPTPPPIDGQAGAAPTTTPTTTEQVTTPTGPVPTAPPTPVSNPATSNGTQSIEEKRLQFEIEKFKIEQEQHKTDREAKEKSDQDGIAQESASKEKEEDAKLDAEKKAKEEENNKKKSEGNIEMILGIIEFICDLIHLDKETKEKVTNMVTNAAALDGNEFDLSAKDVMKGMGGMFTGGKEKEGASR